MQDLERLRGLLAELDRRKSEQRIKFFYPDKDSFGFFCRDKYPRHMEFFEAGKDSFARLAMCANGAGKTEGMGGYEYTCHVTLDYPDWWVGHRFNRSIDTWVVGPRGKTVRDSIQTKLLGRPYQENKGGGLIPVSAIDFDSIRRMPGITGGIDSVRIKNKLGEYSYLTFKSYEQGLDAFFAEEKDLIWLDEPPPVDIFGQCASRTRNRPGAMLMVTATPLDGRTETIKLFLDTPDRDRKVIYCGWDDVPHLTEEEKRRILSAQPAYLRDTVSKGIPTRGQGAVYPVDEKDFVINPIKVPDHWPRVFGFDGGYHNTAAVWLAWDKDTDTVYVTDEYKAGEVDYAIHADAIKKRGTWIPGVGDAAAIGQLDGVKTLDAYRRAGVNLRLADKSVNAGITEVLNRLSTNRLKVFSTCQKWLDEFRTYSYDENQKIVKRDDHLMDATRYGIYSGLKIATNRVRERLIITEASFG